MSLDLLLEVQAHDSTIDRLTHQRANLPVLGAIGDCDDEAAHLQTQRGEVEARRHELERQQKRLEDDVSLVEDRRNSENERLYSGSVTAHKDLQAIQAELAVLGDRQADLEDQVLEVMEAMEPVTAELAAVDDKLVSVAERRAGLEATLAQEQGEIDEQISGEHQARAELANRIDGALMVEYERVRAAQGGVGIARLNGKTCEGCHLQLSAVDYDRIRKEPSDALVHCTECRRILVR